jgi:Protein of unknown function (DUF2934)
VPVDDRAIKEIAMTTKTGTPKATAKSRKPAAKNQLAPAPSAGPSKEEIARLAEKYWAERGWPQGSPEQDWLRAEQELRTAS